MCKPRFCEDIHILNVKRSLWTNSGIVVNLVLKSKTKFKDLTQNVIVWEVFSDLIGKCY